MKHEDRADSALEAVKGSIRFSRTLGADLQPLAGEHPDWCISRQLWWGIRFRRGDADASQVYVARSETDALKQSGGKPLTRDPDVLDTGSPPALVSHHARLARPCAL